MTRKEQKEERRKQILMTALTLFVERGYYDTKIVPLLCFKGRATSRTC